MINPTSPIPNPARITVEFGLALILAVATGAFFVLSNPFALPTNPVIFYGSLVTVSGAVWFALCGTIHLYKRRRMLESVRHLP